MFVVINHKKVKKLVMKNKKGFARLTIDLPSELHKNLKVKCAIIETSMRDLVIEAIEDKVQSLAIKISKELNE